MLGCKPPPPCRREIESKLFIMVPVLLAVSSLVFPSSVCRILVGKPHNSNLLFIEVQDITASYPTPQAYLFLWTPTNRHRLAYVSLYVLCLLIDCLFVANIFWSWNIFSTIISHTHKHTKHTCTCVCIHFRVYVQTL